MPTGPTKVCAGCGKEKDRLADFAPRWGRCPEHKPYDPKCSACLELRNDSTRQPRCHDCDGKRDKKPKGIGRGKGKKPPKAPKPAAPAAIEPPPAEELPEAPAADVPPPEDAPAPEPEDEESESETEATPATATAKSPETTAALIAKPPSDSHGPLTRQPALPKRGIGVMLKRALATLKNRCARVTAGEKKLAEEKLKLVALVADGADKGAARERIRDRLASLQGKLDGHRTARDFTCARARLFAGELQRRTLARMRPDTERYKQFTRLVEITEDVIDTTILQASGSDASDAFTRIVSRIGPRMGRLVAMRVRSELMKHGDRQLAEDEARSRRDEGIFKGAVTFDPKYGAALATRCYMPVLRALQIRTRADRKIGVQRCEDAAGQERWDSGATSLDALAGTGDEEGFEPLAASYSARGTGMKSVSAAVAEQGRVTGVAFDLSDALATLDSDEDRQIVERVIANEESRKSVAEGMGISVTALNTRVAVLVDQLRDKLAAYSTIFAGEENDDL